MSKIKIAITGLPGSGKSTLLNKILDYLRSKGYIIGGIICPDVRDSRGYRIGFKIVDIFTGEEAWLARKGYGTGPRIGKYIVNVNGAGKLGVKALTTALEGADVIAIDEIGPMELLINDLKRMFIKVLKSDKHTIVVHHRRLSDSTFLTLLSNYRRYVVTRENRQQLYYEILTYIDSIIKE